MKQKQVIKGIITLLFIFLLVVYVKSINWKLLLEFIQKIRIIIFLTIGLSFAALICKIYRLKLIVNSGQTRINFSQAIFVQSSSILLAIISPFRLGEFAKIYLLNKNNVDLSFSFFSFFCERSSDLLILLLGSSLFIQNYVVLTNLQLKLILLLIFISIFIFFFLFYFAEKIKDFLLIKNFSFLNKILTQNRTIKSLLLDVHFPQDRLMIIYVLIITIITWILESLITWNILYSLNINTNFVVIFAIICISTIASLLSILPAGAGSLDFSYVYLMTQSAVPKEAAIFALLWIRLVTIIMILIMSVISYYFNRISRIECLKT